MVGLLLPSIYRPSRARDELNFDVVAVTDVTLCCLSPQTLRRH